MAGGKVLNTFVVDGDAIRPWRGGHIFARLLCIWIAYLYPINVGKSVGALCQNQSNYPGAGAHIERPTYALYRYPCPEQHGIGTYLHGATVVLHTKLFEIESVFSSLTHNTQGLAFSSNLP